MVLSSASDVGNRVSGDFLASVLGNQGRSVHPPLLQATSILGYCPEIQGKMKSGQLT